VEFNYRYKKLYMNKKNIKQGTVLILFLIGMTLLNGCKKLVEVNPPINSVTGSNVYNSNANAAAVMTGIYSSLSSGNFTSGVNGVSVICGLSADELIGYATGNLFIQQAYTNSLSSLSVPFWNRLYTVCIYPSNAAISGVSSSKVLSTSVRNQIIGEAKFIRAFSYFYLTNIFGDVPLITTTDYTESELAFRTPKGKVYQQIIADLNDAKGLLSSDYLDATLLNTTTERVRPTKWAAESLLARAYLYSNKWDSAELESTAVINNSTMYSLSALNDVFLANSSEAIWQLQPVIPEHNTEDGNTFILVADPTYNNPVSLSDFLLNSFEAGDGRKAAWVDSYNGSQTYYFPKKYKIKSDPSQPTEYLTVLRLAEQYLIRAEARAHLSKSGDAENDLNLVRSRASLSDTSSANQSELLGIIMHERRVELFTEWGHRWLDLKRTNTVDSVMSAVCPAKGGNWKSQWQLYPIPQQTIQFDHNLTQYPGYN